MVSSEASVNPFAIIMAGGVETSPVANSNLSMNVNSETKPKKTNRGRVKIPIEKIMNKNKKHVTFSKRRKGLFKKATELCVLCDASVAIVTFSEAGKVFAFGHPSTDAVIHRYLNGGDGTTHLPIVASTSQLKHEYNGGGVIENPGRPWWDRPIEELGLEELETYAESLNQTLSILKSRITQLDYESQLDSKPLMKLDYSDHDFCQNQGGRLQAMGNQMNYCYNGYDMMNGVGDVDPKISSFSPDFLSTAPQYDQSDINSVVGMADFNRSNRGYGGFQPIKPWISE